VIVTATPYRVSLAGGGAGDSQIWFRQHGGTVLGGSVNHFCWLTVRRLPPYHDFKNRVAYRKVETTLDVASIEHPAVRACLELTGVDGVEVSHTGDLPGRSGLGSSSSFVVGLLQALHALKKEFVCPGELAREAMRVEQDVLKEAVGCQDQLLAAHGNLNVLTFCKSGEMRVTPLGLSPEHQGELESHLMLFFTRVERISSDVTKSYGGWESKREANFAQARLAGDAIEAVQRRDWARLGWVLDQSFRVKLSLSPAVAFEGLHRLYAELRLSGAWGGKLTGAGGGGSFLLCVPPEKQKKVLRVAEGAGMVHIPFRFTEEGSRVVFCR
jgi:D-glycero-alpha-D-manno-heptose-7-phosphate kinase